MYIHCLINDSTFFCHAELYNKETTTSASFVIQIIFGNYFQWLIILINGRIHAHKI